jgi:NAD(P)-dependent dehydrogenase (short-subunit alcohol dehydrogenase family)
MSTRLIGKKALVTGATAGIGAAIATTFAQEGAQVVLTGRNAKQGQAVVDSIGKTAGSAWFVAADISSLAGVNALVEQTLNTVGPIDILVNNAGIFPMGSTEQVAETTFDTVLATNLKAPFYLTAAFAPRMIEKRGGRIINITSVLAHKGFSGAALYGATKAALTLLTKAWAAEFGPGGVTVNAIAPHLVRTPGTEDNLEALEHFAHLLPARRYALPFEIAQAALYLASEQASFLQGVTLPVDGGYLAS